MGIVISEQRVGRLMREAGLRAVGMFKFRATTNSKHSRPVAPNLLACEFQTSIVVPFVKTGKWVFSLSLRPASFC
jgi:transposase InsO family protein